MAFMGLGSDGTWLNDMKNSQPGKENIQTRFDSLHGTRCDGTQPDDVNYSQPGKENMYENSHVV